MVRGGRNTAQGVNIHSNKAWDPNVGFLVALKSDAQVLLGPRYGLMGTWLSFLFVSTVGLSAEGDFWGQLLAACFLVFARC